MKYSRGLLLAQEKLIGMTYHVYRYLFIFNLLHTTNE